MEDILNPDYWKRRLEIAAQPHHAIMKCPIEKWLAIEAKHREILKRVVQPDDRILDVGCAMGRCLSLMPEHWRGAYTGVDLADSFIELARKTYPERDFRVGSILEPLEVPPCDIAICISIRPMFLRNLGTDAWERAERNIRGVVQRILYLEYDEHSEGELS